MCSRRIDRQFVRGLDTDAYDSSVVGAMINVAHARRVQVVAEGVETRGEYDALLHLGCDQMQGHFFSAPLPAAELARLLEQKAAAAIEVV